MNHKTNLPCTWLLGIVVLLTSACSEPAPTTESTPMPESAMPESSMPESSAEAPTLPESEDPFLWMEEVEGERALEWVRGQNT
ncbi:MAG: hypothetical protein AAF529_18640, partial [Pseudomonadota bacterium]